MPSLAIQSYGLNAIASFAGGNPGSFRVQRGFNNANTRNGAGDQTLTLIDAVNSQTEAIVQATVGNVVGQVGVKFLTTTTIEVFTDSAAGAATDLDFWIQIMRVGPN